MRKLVQKRRRRPEPPLLALPLSMGKLASALRCTAEEARRRLRKIEARDGVILMWRDRPGAHWWTTWGAIQRDAPELVNRPATAARELGDVFDQLRNRLESLEAVQKRLRHRVRKLENRHR